MRKPLAIRNAAARLSAERPSAERDLALRPARPVGERSGVGGGAAGRVSHRRRRLSRAERALIDLAARLAGDGGDLADRLLDRDAGERLSQQGVKVGASALWLGRRRDHQHDLAARCAGRA